ncbi:MAG: type II secretion system protein GspD [Armatimonadetes bacterium]|nr:type II secretion system protein GspD [Armatimonadota bacterium]
MSFVHRWGCDSVPRAIVTAGIVAVLTVLSTAVAFGEPDGGVLLDVRDAPLTDVVMLLTQQSGANVVVNPDVAGKRVTAYLNGLTLDRVLDHVVKNTAGIEYWRDEDGTYIIGSQKPVEEKPVVVEPAVPALPVEPPRKVTTQIIKLVNSDPKDLLITLGLLAPEQSSNSTFLGLKNGGVLGVLDEDRFQTGLHIPGNPRGHEQVGGVYLDSVPPAIDSGARTSVGEAGRAATPDTGAGQYTGSSRRPTAGAPSSRGPTAGAPGAPGATGAASNTLLPDGVDLVMPFSSDNSIIVRGTEEGIAEFKELVHLLDVPPKQVSIKAEFIEVSTNDVKKLGIDWSLERLNETINTNFNPAGNVVVGVTTGNLAASLRAELTRSSGKIINSPIISTINNEFAMIMIGSQIPYWTTVLQSTGIGQVVSNQIVNSLNVTTYLQVLPRVNGDGTITLTLTPSVQDTGRIYTDPTGNSEIPETRFQSLYTRRRVMNGETIVVGGFIRKDESVTQTQIPILGSLPIIGPLFRSTSKTGQDRELLIFVTPTIIGEKSAGSAVGVVPY